MHTHTRTYRGRLAISWKSTDAVVRWECAGRAFSCQSVVCFLPTLSTRSAPADVLSRRRKLLMKVCLVPVGLSVRVFACSCLNEVCIWMYVLLYMYVYMSLCMYVCTSVRIWACALVWRLYVCLHIPCIKCKHVGMYVCLHVCVWMYIRSYQCRFCVGLCMHVCFHIIIK